MKIFTLALTLVVLAAVSAEAASKTRKRMPVQNPSVTAPHPHPHGVYARGELVGMDPDPFIRLQILRDPKPSEHSGP